VPIVAVCFLLPVSLLRSLNALRHTSFIALGAIVFTVFVVLEEFGVKGPAKHVPLFDLSPRLLSALPLMSLSFAAHMVLCPIASEVAPKQRHRMPRVVVISLSTCIAIYATVGSMGLLTFGAAVDGNILNSYADNDVLASLARAGFFLVITFSYPIILQTHRANLNSLIWGDGSPPLVRHVLTTAVPMGVAVAIALAVPGVAFVFGLNGAINGSVVSFVLPPLFRNRLLPGPVLLSRDKARSTALFFAGWGMLFVGTFATIGNQVDLFGKPGDIENDKEQG
jgi:amino acid permease